MANSRKRKVPLKEEEEASTGGGSSPEELQREPNKGSSRGKRIKSLKPKVEPEFFPLRRNLEDLWQAVFLVGTEWENMDKLCEINWNFSNLERAFDEGGKLHGRKVYLFGSTEAQLLVVNGEIKVVFIPIVVVVVSPIPPSDMIGIKSVQRVKEEIVPMKAMKMAWVPYIPLENRHNQVERCKTQIFIMGCTQRRSALKLLKEEQVKKYNYCLPYLQPLKADEDENDTVVSIVYPYEPPVLGDFDYAMDNIEEFTDYFINKKKTLPQDQKEAFKKFVKEQVRERKRTQRQAREARQRAIEDMGEETRDALENMRFYKFYPISTPDTPDITEVKSLYINRYYRKAHVLL